MEEIEQENKHLKYARTTITNNDGTITTARLNVSTGEIKPYKYNKHKEEQNIKQQKCMFKGLSATHYSMEGNLLCYTPFWALPSADSISNKEVRSYKPRISKDNDNNVFLSDYLCLDHALEDLSMLDNLFEGVSMLNDGKNNPMNKGLMFNLLRDLDVINSVTIQEYTGYSERHCRKLAQYLRVLSNAFDSEIER